jgi:predicted DCC family thiol-disulfide oxidoreductase YuxK
MALQANDSSLYQAWKENAHFKKSGDSSGDSVILQIKGRRYERSSAVLRIAVRLRFPWPLLGFFFIVPTFIRDIVYNLVARNRRQWFGRHSACKIP